MRLIKKWIGRILVSERELVRHLPLFVPPGTDLDRLIEYIRWNVAIGRIPRHKNSPPLGFPSHSPA